MGEGTVESKVRSPKSEVRSPGCVPASPANVLPVTNLDDLDQQPAGAYVVQNAVIAHPDPIASLASVRGQGSGPIIGCFSLPLRSSYGRLVRYATLLRCRRRAVRTTHAVADRGGYSTRSLPAMPATLAATPPLVNSRTCPLHGSASCECSLG